MGFEDWFINVNGSAVGNITQPNGEVLLEIFNVIPRDADGLIQLSFLMVVYGYVLFSASKLIADGSELLMLILNPGIIGGLVLPIMGAIPDGAMVLFSGLGPNAQNSLSIGVGTLAGSTVTLLTLPWMACTFAGAVDIPSDATTSTTRAYKQKVKRTRSLIELDRIGTVPTGQIASNAKIMCLTALLYLVIQAPSFYFIHSDGKSDLKAQAAHEHSFALFGLVLSIISFIGYSFYCVYSGVSQELQEKKMQALRMKAYKNHYLNLSFINTNATEQETKEILWKSFKHYDENNDGVIDQYELRSMFADHGVTISRIDAENLIHLMDKDGGGNYDCILTFEEFVTATKIWLRDHEKSKKNNNNNNANPNITTAGLTTSLLNGAGHRDLESGLILPPSINSEDDEDEDEEHSDKSKFQILMNSLFLMVSGVLVVTLFSDPMINVLNEISFRLGDYGVNISPFYISFIVTPLASNASELISSYVFAKKRTRKSITLTYSALIGAATMNNTFVLSIFLALVYIGNLAWTFSAEVMCVLFVEVSVGLIALAPIQTGKKALLAGLLWPASLGLVMFLENVVGWD